MGAPWKTQGKKRGAGPGAGSSMLLNLRSVRYGATGAVHGAEVVNVALTGSELPC